MNNKTLQIVTLCVLLSIVYCRGRSEQPDTDNPIVDNKPKPKVIVPKVTVPKLENNFIYDDIDKAFELSNIYNKNIIVVFGADWCPYCEELKRDAKTIAQFNQYLVCFIDTDKKDKNQSVINRYKPRSLPTSLFLDTKKKEVSRKTGYKNKDYIKWLNSLESFVR